MRRPSTLARHLRELAADLDLVASHVEDRDGMVPGRAHIVGQLHAAASDAIAAATRVENVLRDER